jgi:hypothetical protein
MPPASGNRKFATLERRKRVADLYLTGKSQWHIAHELGINQGTVSRDLEALRIQWRASNQIKIDAIQERELAKLDLIEAEAWVAWEASKQNKERTTKERSSGESCANSKVVVVTESRLPDPEYLKTVQWCINKRCEIIGLDAATKINHGGEISDPMNEADKAVLIGNIVARLGAMEYDRLHEDDAGDHAGGAAGASRPGIDLDSGGAASDAAA